MDPWLGVTRARTWQRCGNEDLALWGYLLPFLCSPFSDHVLMSSRPPAALAPYVE